MTFWWWLFLCTRSSTVSQHSLFDRFSGFLYIENPCHVLYILKSWFCKNKWITLFLSPGFPCSRLNQLIIRQGLIILVAISKACIWNIFYFTHKHSHLGKARPHIILQVSGKACGCQWSFGRNKVPLQSTFTPQLGSTYSTPGFNHFTPKQILFSHTDIVKYPSRHIISSQTRFTLPTENLISLRFIIVAHTRHNIFGGSVGTNFLKVSAVIQTQRLNTTKWCFHFFSGVYVEVLFSFV